MRTFTLRSAKEIVRSLGLTLVKDSADDYVVKPRGASNDHPAAYFTPDLVDAVETARAMAPPTAASEQVKTPRTMKEMQRDYHATIVRITDLAFTMYLQNANRRLYLIGLRPEYPGGVWQEFKVVPDDSVDDREGWWFVVRPDPLPRHLPIEALRDHVKDILKREPLREFTD